MLEVLVSPNSLVPVAACESPYVRIFMTGGARAVVGGDLVRTQLLCVEFKDGFFPMGRDAEAIFISLAISRGTSDGMSRFLFHVERIAKETDRLRGLFGLSRLPEWAILGEDEKIVTAFFREWVLFVIANANLLPEVSRRVPVSEDQSQLFGLLVANELEQMRQLTVRIASEPGASLVVKTAFPKECALCRTVFSDFEDFKRRTEGLPNAYVKYQAIGDGNLYYHANCLGSEAEGGAPCNTTMVVALAERRNSGPDGLHRRQLFDEALRRLIDEGNASMEEGRYFLLEKIHRWTSESAPALLKNRTSLAF